MSKRPTGPLFYALKIGWAKVLLPPREHLFFLPPGAHAFLPQRFFAPFFAGLRLILSPPAGLMYLL
jgi:hypothetical protein